MQQFAICTQLFESSHHFKSNNVTTRSSDTMAVVILYSEKGRRESEHQRRNARLFDVSLSASLDLFIELITEHLY